jgi:hypothetical protein
MSEAAIAGAVTQVAEPIVAAVLEDLHSTTSAAIASAEQTAPARLEAAETDVKDWAEGLLGKLHAVVAQISQHRGNLGTPAFAAKAQQIIAGSFYSELRTEVGRIEAEMPKELDGASPAVKYWAGDVMTLLHKLSPAPDVDAASSKPAQVHQLPEGESAQFTGPAIVGPGPHQGIEVPPGETGTASNEAPTPTDTKAEPSDAKPSA